VVYKCCICVIKLWTIRKTWPIGLSWYLV